MRENTNYRARAGAYRYLHKATVCWPITVAWIVITGLILVNLYLLVGLWVL